jgi:beta-galactosidase
MMKFFLLTGVSVCMLIHAIAQPFNNPRIKYNFNPGWKMMVGDDPNASAIQYDDKSWKAVTLPHAFNEDDAFKKAIADLTTGIVWYRKHFIVPKENKGQKIFLEFEGIRHGGEFFLNGKSIGLSENGVMAFGFDISDEIKFGEDNVLAARISNAWDYKEKATGSTFEWSDRNFYANYGGINKNVYLHITGKLYQTLPLYSNLKTTGVYVYAKDFDIRNGSAFITAETQVKNEYATAMDVDYSVVVEDAVTGKKITTIQGTSQKIGAGETKNISAGSKTSGLNFWSWGYGYLYNVYTILQSGGKTIDVVKTTTGFRKTSFENGMFHLNDRVMQVKGYGQRTTNEWPAIGLSVPAWMSDYSNGLMVTGNASLVRWMHVTPWKQDVESCDRVGLMEAMPAGDAEKDVDGRRWEQRTEVMRDAIIYNRNNPSIIFYECGNKGISEEHMLAMKKIRDEYDPNGGRAIGCREMLESKMAEYGGEMLYINKSATKPLWSMEYSRDEGLRKYWDEYSPPYHKEGDGPLYKGANASEYNHNQDAHAIEDVVRWYDYWHERPGTGKRVNDGGVNIIFSESNTHFRGAENYRRSGEVDALRIPKDGFYANQAMWDGWVDIERPRVHIIGHWNYKEGVIKNVYVVSSADKVELFLNGKSLGSGEKSNQFLYTFKNIAWYPGIISAIGYDKAGKKLCEDKHETAGEPASIRLREIKSPRGFIADGADLALVEVEVTDAKGNRCPTALNTIHFELSGPGEWRGGMAQGPDNYILSQTLPVECGVNRILIRSTTRTGTIAIYATSKGLKSGILSITAKPFIQNDGLSIQMPADGLKSYLQRGPTPTESSYTPSRIALKIINATAGTNADKTTSSYDDNETTDWVNDGQLSTAWIEYELEKAAPISQVALKLNNFRTRSYPLRISVDGKEVFKDSTTRNLGYFTAIFKPTTGKKIKIELYRASNTKEDASTEVNGKKLDDGVTRDDANAKGRFSIIEAEVYEVLKEE